MFQVSAGWIIQPQDGGAEFEFCSLSVASLPPNQIEAGVIPSNFSDLAGQIGGADIAAGAIVASKIAANAVIAGKIAANADYSRQYCCWYYYSK